MSDLLVVLRSNAMAIALSDVVVSRTIGGLLPAESSLPVARLLEHIGVLTDTKVMFIRDIRVNATVVGVMKCLR